MKPQIRETSSLCFWLHIQRTVTAPHVGLQDFPNSMEYFFVRWKMKGKRKGNVSGNNLDRERERERWTAKARDSSIEWKGNNVGCLGEVPKQKLVEDKWVFASFVLLH